MNPNDVLTITMRESGPLCRRTYDAPDGRRMSETLTPDDVRRWLAQAEMSAEDSNAAKTAPGRPWVCEVDRAGRWYYIKRVATVAAAMKWKGAATDRRIRFAPVVGS